MMVNISDQQDKFAWKLTKSGIFTVKSMYLDLMNEDARFLHIYLWKLKLPLKIKIFMWLLRGKVLFTKDNIVKRKWKGRMKCCFCDSKETVQHLFISCRFVHIIWRMIYFTDNLPPPTSITNMFGNWLNGIPKNDKARLRVGVSALCWSIWTCCNNMIFNKQKHTNFLQVICLAAYWIHMWSYLLPVDQRELMAIGYNRLLMVAQDFFFWATGWRHINRIENV
jgi:hypothetical protein